MQKRLPIAALALMAARVTTSSAIRGRAVGVGNMPYVTDFRALD